MTDPGIRIHSKRGTGHRAAIYALAPGEQDDRFISAGGDGLVVSWSTHDTADGLALADAGEATFSVAVDRTRQLLFIGTRSGRLQIVDLGNKRVVSTIAAHNHGIFSITPQGSDAWWLAGGDGSISLWAWSEGTAAMTLIERITLCAGKVRALRSTRNGQVLGIALADGLVRELHAPDWHERARWITSDESVMSLIRTRDGQWASGGKDGHLRFHGPDGAIRSAWPVHRGAVYALEQHPEHNWLITAGRDALVKVWEPDTMRPVCRSQRSKEGHTHSVNCALWSAGKLITGSDDRTIRVWDFTSE